MKVIKNVWMAFARKVGKINTAILLSLFYFIFFGLYAVIGRMAILFSGRRKKTTGWIPYDNQPETLEQLSREF